MKESSDGQDFTVQAKEEFQDNSVNSAKPCSEVKRINTENATKFRKWKFRADKGLRSK